MPQNAPYKKEARFTTSKGDVRIRSYCAPEEIRRYDFDDEFGVHAQFKSLYTRRESLEADAADPEANIVLALSDDDRIIGFAVLAYPDEGERWLDLGPKLMMELRVIEVCRHWRSARLARELLAMALGHPAIEEKIAYMIGYSWTWDLDGTHLRAQEYRQVLIRLFETQGFREYETNEPNICLKQENLFMCRVGGRVPEDVIDRFNWLRFGIATEPEATADTAAAGHHAPARSLFHPLKEEGLTFLGIYYNWKKDRLSLRAGQQWDVSVDWRDYNHLFTVEHPLISDSRYLGHEQTLGIFEQHGLRPYLDDIVARIKKSRHLGLECYLEPRRGIQVINFMHGSMAARGHIYHALRAGGICCFDNRSKELEVLVDGLNMSRAASFKNAGAHLPFGGCRISVPARGLEITDHAGLGFVAYVIDRTRSVVGPDMGFPSEVADVIRREGYSTNIVGGYDSRLGPPSIPTAFGVYLALKEASYVKFGSLSLTGRKIVVQGAGAVGTALVEKYLAAEEADIHICDIQPQPVARLQAKLGGRVTVLDPDDVLDVDGDMLVPCAKGGILDQACIGRLKYDIVLGAANNTLRAADQKEEIRLARLLAGRGILYQVDWMHNTAGVIVAAETYLHQHKASLETVMHHVERVCRDGVRENFKAARANGITPTEQAYKHYNAVIYA